MSGAVVTGAFVMAGVGAFYLLQQKFVEHARIFLRVGVVAGFGNVKADVLADKDPKFQRINFCSLIRGSHWKG
jgi:cytochrome bd-type quinol oxidase subunit 1